MTERTLRIIAIAAFTCVLSFVVGTYSYYRGSVITPYHEGSPSPSRHHYTLTAATMLEDGSVRFHLYLDGGTPETPSHIVSAELADREGRVVASWDANALSSLPIAAIQNDFAYNQAKAAPFGLAVSMGAIATVTLPPPPQLSVRTVPYLGAF